ncbi:hypothetical protein ACCT30_28830, partial [Rhizobium ruizarguesonis]
RASAELCAAQDRNRDRGCGVTSRLASSADKLIQETRKPESDSLSGFVLLKIKKIILWSR